MLVTVLAVVAFVGVPGVHQRQRAHAGPGGRLPGVGAGRACGRQARSCWRRTGLPLGWKATSATYTRGVSPTWHLGMLTDDAKYVGVEEARDEHRGPRRGARRRGRRARARTSPSAARPGRPGPTRAGTTRSRGRLDGPEGAEESVLVVGSAPPSAGARLRGGR